MNTDINTDTSSGLSEAEAIKRLKEFGPNKLEEEEETLLERIIEPFQEPMMILLLITGVIYSFLGEPLDAVAIFIIIGIIGFVEAYQEYRAEKSIKSLKKLTSPMAKVIRDSDLRIMPSDELVVGDLILLELGDKVPADTRIVESTNLKVEESWLTGESTPVDKQVVDKIDESASIHERKGTVFSGTAIVYGKAKGVVIATGMNTEMGKIAQLVQDVEEEPTPLQTNVKQLTQLFVIGSVSLCIFIVLFGVLRGNPMIDMVLFGLSLAVATIPEDLPIILTIILAMGGWRMSRQKALFKKIYGIETLGAVSVICTDKTGTLTQNKMTVDALYVDGYTINAQEDMHKVSDNLVLAQQIGILCNDAKSVKEETETIFIGDPTDTALLYWAQDNSIDVNEVRKQKKLVTEYPFTSDRKIMSAVYISEDGGYDVYSKGAPEMLLEKCTRIMSEGASFEDNGYNEILNQNNKMAKDGLRVIATAYKHMNQNIDLSIEFVESDLSFVSLVGLLDPPREDVKDALTTCRDAKIRTIMITGDQKQTALAIAKKIGLTSNEDVLSGEEIDKMDDIELDQIVNQVDVFSRVSPEHKLRIVRSLKRNGEVVAMTGDGVNDAPAIREADIGVAMGKTGTDVARDASDMILVDDSFSTIVEAVREGRAIFENLRKSITYYISSKITILGLALVSVFLGLPVPLLPIQIILMEVLTDLVASTAFEGEAPEIGIMSRSPRKRIGFLTSRPKQALVLIQGLLIVLGVLWIYLFTLSNSSLSSARTMVFITTLFSIVFLAFNNRSETVPLYKLGLLSNNNLVYFGSLACIVALVVTQVPVFNGVFKTSPLTLFELIKALSISVAVTFWREPLKIFQHH